MTNDAKLGMLAGVLGVIVAAVLFANAPPPTAQSQPSAVGPPPTAAAPTATPEASTAALPSTPVGRTRKDVDAQPASRQAGADEEP